jgi:S-formylglutathione hydrolase FrmB
MWARFEQSRLAPAVALPPLSRHLLFQQCHRRVMPRCSGGSLVDDEGVPSLWGRDLMGSHLSLMHGWIPLTMELITVLTVVVAVGWRTQRWRLLWIPVSAVSGLALAAAGYLFIATAGIAADPAPVALWGWIGLTGLATTALAAGWKESRWWRRCLSVLAVPLSLTCAAATVNDWVGYVPTVGAAWTELTSRPLPDQIDSATVTAMQLAGTIPTKGGIIAVNIDSAASGFQHRDELVYLPPAWFASTPPPPLPAVMMIGGEFNTPTDWLRAGNAAETLDSFAASGGQSPVVVFVDSGGGFNIDTECVNGTRGNAADHLTKDVVPYLIRSFGVSAAPSHWAVAGFSSGGTCAVDLTVMHPELFGSFVDIAGDLRPNSGTTTQTIDRLFGGNRAAWQNFDPSTVITRHGHYQGVSGLFVVSGAARNDHNQPLPAHNAEYDAASQLCSLGTAQGIDCSIIAVPGKHDWPCAASAFATAMPWLATQIGTKGSPRPLPMRQQPGAASSVVRLRPATHEG